MKTLIAGSSEQLGLSQVHRGELFDWLDKNLAANHLAHDDVYSVHYEAGRGVVEVVAYHKNEIGRRHLVGSPLHPNQAGGVALVKIDIPTPVAPPWDAW